MGGIVLGLGGFAGQSLQAETITVGGETYADAEMVEVGDPGVYFRLKEGAHVVLPWTDLSEFQREAVKARFREGIENARYRAIWVEGTIFEKHRDGIVVQVSVDIDAGASEETGTGGEAVTAELVAKVPYREGAEIAKGMVMIKDLQDNAVKKPGDEVSGIFYREKTYTYEVGGFNLVKEIPFCTQGKPEWARFREWTNTDGQQISARVIAVQEDKCLFEQSGGQTFPYEISKLSEADQGLVAKFARRFEEIPLF